MNSGVSDTIIIKLQVMFFFMIEYLDDICIEDYDCFFLKMDIREFLWHPTIQDDLNTFNCLQWLDHYF